MVKMMMIDLDDGTNDDDDDDDDDVMTTLPQAPVNDEQLPQRPPDSHQ